MTLLLPIDPFQPESASLERVGDILRQGGIVAYPTETLYGLGVDPFNPDAMERLSHLKGRPGSMPVSVLVRDIEMLGQVVWVIPTKALRVIEALLPGPLTVVLQAKPHVPDPITGGTGKVGVRISTHPLMRHLFRYHASPFTTTSANPTGQPGATDARQVLDYFPQGIDCVLDGGPVPGGVESTVVDLSKDPPLILREGAIPESEILKLFQ